MKWFVAIAVVLLLAADAYGQKVTRQADGSYRYEYPPMFGRPVEKTSDGHTEITLNNVVVTDADTIRGDVMMKAEVGENLYWNVRVKTRPIEVELLAQRIRVVGVDSPELRTPKGDAAKLAVEKLIEGKIIKLTPRGKDNFGRLLAIVTLVDKDGNETILADWLIKHKHGIVYKP